MTKTLTLGLEDFPACLVPAFPRCSLGSLSRVSLNPDKTLVPLTEPHVVRVMGTFLLYLGLGYQMRETGKDNGPMECS